jgi:nucleotide-binding universal stress UspA family protein
VTARRAGVVVAVADGDGADRAVEWAAAEAAAADRPLRIVHVAAPRLPLDPWGFVAPPGEPFGAETVGKQVLEAARERAGSVAGELEISARLHAGPVGPVLLHAAEGAALLVLGGRRHGAIHRVLTGSVSGHLLAHVPGPVAVVHPASGTPPRSAPRVVVGVPAGHSSAAVGFAFAAAARRGIPLVAVRGWERDVPADLEGACGSAAAAESRAADGLEEVLEPWRRRFPAVPVQRRLPCAELEPALIVESRGAALLVVGRGERRSGPGSGSGAVSRIAQRADAPVAVVPAGAARSPAGEGAGRRATRSDRSPGRRTPWG